MKNLFFKFLACLFGGFLLAVMLFLIISPVKNEQGDFLPVMDILQGEQ